MTLLEEAQNKSKLEKVDYDEPRSHKNTEHKKNTDFVNVHDYIHYPEHKFR